MKKIFTLVCAALLSVGLFADEATLVLNSGATSTPSDFFTVAKGSDNPSYNANYTGVYDGVTYTKGLKMESATTVSFTTDASATITVVQSTAKNGDKTINFDGAALTDGKTDVTGTTTCKVYTVTKVAAGDHTISRGNGETGLLYVKVEWEGSNPTCAAPTITISEEWSEENNGYQVELTNNETGATLTYAINDGDFQAYTAAFYVPSKAKVVAKASKQGYNDKTATATAPLHILIREIEKDTLILAVGDTVSEKMEVHAPHITLILNDASWQNNSKAAAIDTVIVGFEYTAFVAGNTNPTVKNNVPSAGCFYTFLPQVDGTLEIGAKINTNKNLCVSEEGTLLAVKVNDKDVAAGAVVDKDAAVYGKIVFEVKKDKTYYAYCTGSKLSFYGFKFAEKADPTALDNTDAAVKATKVVRNGQLLIEKNGEVYNVLGARIR